MSNFPFSFFLLFLSFHFNVSASCLNMKKMIDMNCSCKVTNTCYEVLSKKNKKWYIRKSKTKTSKKLLAIKFRSDKAFEKLFSNEITPYNTEFDKINVLYHKVGRIKDKQLKKYQNRLKKKGTKNWKIKNRLKGMRKIYDRQIAKNQSKRKSNEGFLSEFQGFMKSIIKKQFPGLAKSQAFKAISPISQKKQDDEVQKTSFGDSSSVKVSKYESTSRNRRERINNQNYKYNTIIEDKNTPIFAFISRRYRTVQRRLSFRSLEAKRLLSKSDKKNIHNSFKELINKL